VILFRLFDYIEKVFVIISLSVKYLDMFSLHLAVYTFYSNIMYLAVYTFYSNIMFEN